MNKALSVLKVHALHLIGFAALAGSFVLVAHPLVAAPLGVVGLALFGKGVKNKTELLAAAIEEGKEIVSELVE